MAEESRAPIRLGSCSITFKPHYLAGIGAQVFVISDKPSLHETLNLTADDARRFAERLKIAACQAEAMERRAVRRNHSEDYVEKG